MSDLQPHALAQLALSLTESSRRAELEAVIELGLATFITVGNALLEIRDSRLYRDTHSTFEDYCRERWQMVASRARQLIGAAEVVANLQSVTTVTPTSERQVRPLAGLEPEQQREAWAAAVESAPNGKVTAEHVSRVAEVIKAIPNKPAASRLGRKERVEQAWQDIGRIFRFGQKSLDAFRASQRMTDAEALEFESLESDADKLRVRQAIQNNQSFSEAVKPLAGVDPKDAIEKLHTKTVRNDGFFAGQVGEFYHAIVLGDRAALLERLAK
jgi:hypothetical protein